MRKPVGFYTGKLRETENDTKFCSCDFDKENCVISIVNAHTVSKGASLSEIQVDGHVHFLETDPSLYRPGVEAFETVCFRRIGINHASTIRAFCSRHDQLLFKQLDSFNLSDAPLFFWQLFYRTLCFERYRKIVAKNYVPLMRDLDCGFAFSDQPGWQDFVTRNELGHSMGFLDLDEFKNTLEECFIKQTYRTELKYLYYEIPYRLPIAASGNFQPDLSVDGKKLQNVNFMVKVGSEILGPNLDQICMSILPSEDKTFLSFCTLSSHLRSLEFIKTFARVSSATVDNFVGLAVLKMENVFFGPAFVESQSDFARRKLRVLHSFGIGKDVKVAEMNLAMRLGIFAPYERFEPVHNLSE